MLEIIPYESRYQEAFRSLNEEWLDYYNLKEDHDMVILNDPSGMILGNGGEIVLARIGDKIVGTAALMREHDGVFELVKMAVDKEHRNQGIGNKLIESCLERARALRAEKILLFSNHQLKSALKLYEKYGFKYIPVKDSPFLTADIKMELVLQY